VIAFTLCDLQGRALSDPLRLPGGQVALAINDRRTGQAPIGFDEPAAAQVRPLVTVLKARWAGSQLLTGVVLRPQFAGAQRTVTVPAIDPSARLAAAFIGARSDGAGLPGAPVGDPWHWAAVDQSEMLARLVEHASPTAAELAEGTPDHGVIRGSLPATVNRDRTYEVGKQIWEAMTQLSAVIDGVDFELEPLDRTDGVLAQLNTYTPFQGTDRSDEVVLHYGWGRHNASDFSWEPAGDILKNRSTRVGQAPTGGGPAPTATEEQAESRRENGIWAEYQGDTDVIDQPTLVDHANATLAKYAWPVDFFTVIPATDDGTGWRRTAQGALEQLPGRYGVPPLFHPNGAYWLGDIIRVVARDRPGLDEDLVGRVLGAKLTNAPNGGVVPELQCAPVVGGGFPTRGAAPPTFRRDYETLRQQVRLLTISQ
jgi:hypothetical protein